MLYITVSSHALSVCWRLRDAKEMFFEAWQLSRKRITFLFILALCSRSLPCCNDITYRRMIRSYVLQIWKVCFFCGLWHYCILGILDVRDAGSLDELLHSVDIWNALILWYVFNRVVWPHVKPKLSFIVFLMSA